MSPAGIQRRGKSFAVYGYHPKTRKWTYVGTRPTERAARELKRCFEDEKERRSPLTCGEWAEQWLALRTQRGRLKDSTLLNNRQEIAVFIRDFGDIPLADVTRAQAEDWSLRHRGAMKSARAMFGDAVRREIIDRNPFAGLGIEPSRGRRDIEVVTPAEINDLLHAAERHHGVEYGPHFAALIATAAYTGLRAGELFALHFSDIDFAKALIRVERQYSSSLGRETTPKSGRSREVVMLDQARDALRSIPRRIDRGNDGLVFRAKRGGRLTQSNLSWAYTPVRAAVGLQGKRGDFHSLRHHYGTLLASRGVYAPDIARAMGHSDNGETATRNYIHIAERESQERIRRAFRPAAKLRGVGEGLG